MGLQGPGGSRGRPTGSHGSKSKPAGSQGVNRGWFGGSSDNLKGIYARTGLQPPKVAEEVLVDLKRLFMILEELLISKGSVKINHKSVNFLHHKNRVPL